MNTVIMIIAAQWIAGTYVPPAETNEAAFFMEARNDVVSRNFAVADKPIKRASLSIAAPSMRDVTINGYRVTETALGPLTPYNKRIYSENFEVAGFLKRDADNTIRIELGNGWWNLMPLRMWYHYRMRDMLPQGIPCVKATLTVEYGDGAVETIETDDEWTATKGKIVKNSIYLGVLEDSRLAEESPINACVVAGPKGELMPAGEVPHTEIIDRFKPKAITSAGNGRWLVDFGVNYAGTYKVKLHDIPVGAKVSFRSGERLHKDGSINVLTAVAGQVKNPKRGPFYAIAEQRDGFIGRGADEDIFEPRFTFHVFRYIEVVGLEYQPKIDDFEALVWSADIDDAASFTCSHAKLNKLHEIARRTFRCNLQGTIQSDCPGREKFGYGGDIAVSAEAFRSNYAMAPLYRKIVRDFIDEAADDGLLVETAPFVGIASSSVLPAKSSKPGVMATQKGTRAAPIGWTLGLPVMLDLLVRYDGDLEIVKEAYPTIKRFYEIVAKEYPTDNIPRCLGDWIALEKADCTLSALAYWREYITYSAKFARLLGLVDDAVRFDAHAARVAAKFRKDWLRANGVVNKGYQGEQLYALHNNMFADRASEQAAYNVLKADLVKHGKAFTTGISTMGYLFEYLGSHGDAALAGDCLTDEKGGYFHIMNLGATTLWESFDDKECSNSYSNCHPMFGSFEAFFLRYVLGIRVTEDAIGGDKVIIAPNAVAGITWAKGYLDVAKGRISVSWKLVNGKLETSVSLPDGVKRIYR